MTTWAVLRAAGIGSYLMLFLSVAWGLASTTSAFGKRFSKVSITTVHQFTSTCGLFLLAIHVGGLLVDSFTPFSVRDVAIPMATSYRPVAVAFGIVAMYAMVFVIVTSWLRRRIGTMWWRRSHLLAVPIFVLSLVHGVFAGTDSVRDVMWWTYLSTGLVVVFLLVVRALTAGYRPERARLAPSAHRARRRAPDRPPRPARARTRSQRFRHRPASNAHRRSRRSPEQVRRSRHARAASLTRHARSRAGPSSGTRIGAWPTTASPTISSRTSRCVTAPRSASGPCARPTRRGSRTT